MYTVCAASEHNLLDKGGGEIVFLYASLAVAGRSGERGNLQGLYLLSQEQRTVCQVICGLTVKQSLSSAHHNIHVLFAVPGWYNQFRNRPFLFAPFIGNRGGFVE
ncbi:MAG: hypothetical protein IMF07_06340 [Proteobacteria bacterium]|nr:hypothetical protein [Pseudomonadota bacterium]